MREKQQKERRKVEGKERVRTKERELNGRRGVRQERNRIRRLRTLTLGVHLLLLLLLDEMSILQPGTRRLERNHQERGTRRGRREGRGLGRRNERAA